MAWKPLRVSSSASSHLPPLLLSVEFPSDSSYTIHLTDLTNLWSESLSRRDIIRRSQQEETSIDPSDGDQLHIFLDKVKLGLEGGNGTTAALTINADDDRPSITLNLKVTLPGGLMPLEWPVRLSAAPQTQLAGQFIIPLIEAQQARMQEAMSLAEALRDKDHVIQKLLDKLEYQGTSLGEVFPQATGKSGRKIDRKTAEERVKGLGQFNLANWRNNAKREISHDTVTLLSEVFRDDGGDGSFAVEANAKKEESEEDGETWWDDIKGITVNLQNGKISTNLGKSKSKSPIKKNPPKPIIREPSPEKVGSSDDNDDFQTQELPNHLKFKNPDQTPEKAAEPVIDSDDDDLDAPSQLSKIPDSFPLSQPKCSPPPPSKISNGFKKAGGKNIGGDESTDDDEPRSKPIKKSLGGVGSKKAPTPKADSSTSDDDELVTKPNKKLSKIGAKKSQPRSSPSAKVDEASTEDEDRPPKTLVNKSPPSETATEDEEPFPPKETKKPPKDDDDSDTASSSPSSPPPLKRKGGLGRIGANKKAPSPSPEPSPVAESSTTPKKKGKLGKIGGRKAPVKESTSDTEDGSDSAPEITTPAKKRLGQIGGRKREASSPAAPSQETGPPDRGRPVAKVKKEDTPPVRETSEERADKKRLEIKKQLEAKAKAAPPKKKRKF